MFACDHQAEVHARADEPRTAFWRLTDGRVSPEDKTAAGRVDFVLQVRSQEHLTWFLSSLCSLGLQELQPGHTRSWHLHNRPRSAHGRMQAINQMWTCMDLQESPTENPYLSAISSHFSYWTNADTALLLARAVSGLDVLTGKPKGRSSTKEVTVHRFHVCRFILVWRCTFGLVVLTGKPKGLATCRLTGRNFY
jgi:DDHD domain